MSGRELVSPKLRDFSRRLRDEEHARHVLYPRTRLAVSTKKPPRFPERTGAATQREGGSQ